MSWLHSAALAAVLFCGAASAPAHAQTPAPAPAQVPPDAPAAELPPPAPVEAPTASLPLPSEPAPAPTAATAPEAPPPAPERPRIEVAVGMGASIDDTGLTQAGLSAIPAFFVMGGFGDGLVGFDFGLFTNSANGRYREPNVPVDRLDVDGMLVFRPAAAAPTAGDGAGGYARRVLRAAALDLGLGYERSSRIFMNKPEEASRLGLRVGAHVDIPLTPAPPPGGGGSELRLRLAVRRLFGLSNAEFADGSAVPDTRAELFAALAVVF